MRTFRWVLIAVAFLVPFAIVTFLPSEEARLQALEQEFTPEQIERGQQYALERRLFFWSSTVLHLALLVVLVVHSRRIADTCATWARGWWLPTVLLVGLTISLAEEAVSLPFGLARLEHLRSWGLTKQSMGDWLSQHFLALGVFGGIEALVLIGFYLLLRYCPRTWWLWSAAGTTLVSIVGVYLLPIVFAPLFNTFEPLSQTKWRHLEPMVQRQLTRVNVEVQDVLVMDASRQSGHTNAYFTGFGSTRRIVLYDTLLEKNSEAEVESILAHELGHWLHDHIVKGLALGAGTALIGLYLLYRILLWLRGRSPWFLYSAADPASLPVIVLIGLLGTWLLMPVESAISRSFERQADAKSLELADADAFISAEKKLALDNLSDLAPHSLRVILFASHPTTVQRIHMALEWKKRH